MISQVDHLRSDGAERSIIATSILSEDAYTLARDQLSPSDFYRPSHQKLWSVLGSLYLEYNEVDLHATVQHLAETGDLEKVGGEKYVVELFEETPTVHNPDAWIGVIQKCAARRRIVQVANKLAADALVASHPEALIGDALARLGTLCAEVDGKGLEHASELVDRELERLQRMYEGADSPALRTRFVKLDEMTGGMRDSEMIVIAARPSVGKSAFALTLAMHASVFAQNPEPGLFISLEMGRSQIIQRAIAMGAHIQSEFIRDGNLGKSDMTRVLDASDTIKQSRLWFDCSAGLTFHRIRARAKRAKAEHDIRYLIVDYLQFMRLGAKSESKRLEIEEMSRGLKDLAKELGIPVIVLSQLNRAIEQRSADDRYPKLSDLRETGAIEQDADQVWMLWRDFTSDNADSTDARLFVRKNRSGATGGVQLRFDPKTTRFHNTDREAG